MSNMSFDTTSFSEQLGIYDFLSVILAGSTFWCGISAINRYLYETLWNDMTFFKGLTIVIIMYITGLILQELGSYLDIRFFGIYRVMNRSILKGSPEDETSEVTSNLIFKNPLVLKRYRENASMLLLNSTKPKDPKYFESDFVNSCFFSICQYYVSVKGKDRKVEKLRGLFAMSKTLVACFASLALCSVFSLFLKSEATISFFNSTHTSNYQCANKIFWAIIFLIIASLFYKRTKRVMKNFLLVLLGTYDAILLAEKNELKKSVDISCEADEKETSNVKKTKSSITAELKLKKATKISRLFGGHHD